MGMLFDDAYYELLRQQDEWAHLAWFEALIPVDSGSADRTQEEE